MPQEAPRKPQEAFQQPAGPDLGALIGGWTGAVNPVAAPELSTTMPVWWANMPPQSGGAFVPPGWAGSQGSILVGRRPLTAAQLMDILVHEMTHARQYATLGPGEFLRQIQRAYDQMGATGGLAARTVYQWPGLENAAEQAVQRARALRGAR